MPHADVSAQYALQLSAKEYRLVALALAGKLKDSEDIKAAQELNVHLCRLRANHLNSQLENAQEALRQAELLANPNVPPTDRKPAS